MTDSTLYWISVAICTPGLALVAVEWLNRPRHLMCDCRSGFQAYRHLKPPGLFTIGVCYVVSDIIDIAAGRRFPILAVLGAYYLWRWWKHTKGGRKRLKDRVLGVVRATAAGLKVVPVSEGAR